MDFIQCEYKQYGCEALFSDTSDEKDHYALESESHLHFLKLKLKIEAQNAAMHKKAYQKSANAIRNLKDENKALLLENTKLQQTIEDLEARNARSQRGSIFQSQLDESLELKQTVWNKKNTSLVSMLYGSSGLISNAMNPPVMEAGTQTDAPEPPLELFPDSSIYPDPSVDLLQSHIEVESSRNQQEALPFFARLDPFEPVWKPTISSNLANGRFRRAPKSTPTHPEPTSQRRDPWRVVTQDPLSMRTEEELLQDLQQLQRIHNSARYAQVKKPSSDIHKLMVQLEKQQIKTKSHLTLRRMVKEYEDTTNLVNHLPKLPPDARLVCDSHIAREVLPPNVRRSIKNKVHQLNQLNRGHPTHPAPNKCPIPHPQLPPMLQNAMDKVHDILIGPIVTPTPRFQSGGGEPRFGGLN